MINNLLSAANVLDEESILRAICETLDVNFEEVQERLAKEKGVEKEIKKVKQNLDNLTPDDEGGGTSE